MSEMHFTESSKRTFLELIINLYIFKRDHKYKNCKYQSC
jgi:hypothetical protein